MTRQVLPPEPYLHSIESRFTWPVLDVWFKGAEFHRDSIGVLISVASPFKQRRIEDHFRWKLEAIFQLPVTVTQKAAQPPCSANVKGRVRNKTGWEHAATVWRTTAIRSPQPEVAVTAGILPGPGKG